MGHHTGKLIQAIKQFNQHFEWYPTTEEQLDVIKSDFNGLRGLQKSKRIGCWSRER